MHPANRRRSGFTLVELSIVLVIIGLIIGGVLTGRQILQNAQITNALNAIQAFEAQFQTYVQNYGALPGDDASAGTRFPNANIPTGSSNSDGTLQGTFDSASSSDETRLAWADLRAADLVKNQTSADPTLQAPNPFNGIFGFQHNAFGTSLIGNVLCLNNVPADAAQAIDARLDDGNPGSGPIQAMVATGTVGEATGGKPAASYGAGQSYTMCIRM